MKTEIESAPAGRIEGRAASGTFAGGLSMFIGMLQSLVQVPILLHYWSPETYADWMVVLAVTAMAASFDIGHQNYLGNRFFRLWVENQNALRLELASGIRFAALIALVELGLIAAAFVARKVEWIDGWLGSAAVFHAVIVYLVFWTINGSVGGVLVRLYPPAGLFARGQWFGVIYRLLGFVALIGAVSLGAGPAWAMAVQVLAWTLFNVCLYVEIWRRFPVLGNIWARGSWAVGWRNFRASLVLTVNSILEQLSTSGLVILVARLLAPAQVAVLTTMRTVANTAIQGTAVLINPVVPDMVRFHVKGDSGKLLGTFATAWMVGGTTVALGFLFLPVFVAEFYALWTRGSLPFDLPLFATLAGAVCVRQWASPLHAYLVGINRLPPQMWMTVLKSAVTLLIAGIVMPSHGTVGAGWGILCGEFTAAAVIAAGVRRELADHDWKFPVSSALWAAAQVAAACLGLAAYCTGVAGKAGVIGTCLVVVVVAGVRQWQLLSPEIQSRAKQTVGRMLRMAGSPS